MYAFARTTLPLLATLAACGFDSAGPGGGGADHGVGETSTSPGTSSTDSGLDIHSAAQSR